MKKFLRNRAAVISTIYLLCVGVLALLGPYFGRYDFDVQNLEERLQSPSLLHLMGTDALGRDVFTRVLYGARISLFIGVVTAIGSAVFATFYGAFAGWLATQRRFGRFFDQLLMRVVDMFYIIPSLLLAILFVVIFGQGLTGILAALCVTSWMNHARLVRGQVLQIYQRLHVEAARAMGIPPWLIVWRHILPLTWGPVLVSITYLIPQNIMTESFLSFIGLGLQPPLASWGILANEGWRGMQTYPHLILGPGLVLFFSLFCLQFFGDGLRDWLDPQTYS